MIKKIMLLSLCFVLVFYVITNRYIKIASVFGSFFYILTSIEIMNNFFGVKLVLEFCYQLQIKSIKTSFKYYDSNKANQIN